MKKSYIKLIVFTLTFILIFLLNSFVFKILNQTFLNLLLIFLLIITYILFGFEKDRHRYTKDVTLEVIIVLITFFLLYYISGLLIGFARTKNYFTINSLTTIIVPTIIYIIFKEILRYQLLTKGSLNKGLIVLITILFITMDTTIAFSSQTLAFDRKMFLLLATTFLPLVTSNILSSFLCLNFGYIPSIIYLLIINLYWYLLPIVPNPNEYIYSIIFFLLPIIILIKINNWLSKDRVEKVVLETYRKSELLYYIPLTIIVIILIYFVSGYFKYYAIAVASGSMEETIYKGDVVIVNKNFNKIEDKDIIAYKYNGRVVVHRVYKIIDINNQYYIYTKGDANKDYDKYKVTKDMVIGVVKAKIPFIGYPTVLLNEKW